MRSRHKAATRQPLVDSRFIARLGKASPLKKRWFIPPALRRARKVDVLVLGSGQMARQLAAAVRCEGLLCRRRRGLASFGSIADGLSSVVLAPPLAGATLAEAIAKYQDRGIARFHARQAIPHKMDFQIGTERGVDAVFSWPSERVALLESVKRIADGCTVDNADIAMEEIARTRVAAAREVKLAAPTIKVRDGLAIIRGDFESSTEARAAQRIVMSVSGVDKVVAAPR